MSQINATTSAGKQLQHLFVRTHLAGEAEAFTVEQAVIDAYHATGHPLTNLVRGHHSSTHGLATVAAVVAEFTARAAPGNTEPTVLFMINRAWRTV